VDFCNGAHGLSAFAAEPLGEAGRGDGRAGVASTAAQTLGRIAALYQIESLVQGWPGWPGHPGWLGRRHSGSGKPAVPFKANQNRRHPIPRQRYEMTNCRRMTQPCASAAV
jgi:hypothetical protein